MDETTETVGIPSDQGYTESALLSPELHVMILTWVTFFILLAILYKFAWKPILATLDQREEKIRRAVEEAEKTHQEFGKINETRNQILTEATQKANEIIAQSRKAALQATKVIEQKAKEEAQIILENTRRELQSEIERARSSLRHESAEIAVDLASKIINENLDNEKNRKLIERFIKEI